MSLNAFKFDASLRERAGKGSARATRREKRIPAVIYGDNKEPVIISLAGNEVQKVLNRGGLLTSLSEITIDKETHRVLARDIQFHPVSDQPLHIDFLRVSPKTKITVSIPVNFINEDLSEGLKRGGNLSIVRHQLDLSCSAANIPDSVDFDLTGLDIGASLRMTDAILPEGSSFPTDDDYAIAAITAPSALLSAEGEASEDGEEGEATAEAGEATPAAE